MVILVVYRGSSARCFPKTQLRQSGLRPLEFYRNIRLQLWAKHGLFVHEFGKDVATFPFYPHFDAPWKDGNGFLTSE